MTIERKAFKTVYRLVADGEITENEAYSLVEAIFAVNMQYVPVPTPVMDEQEPQIDSTVEVKGFLGEK